MWTSAQLKARAKEKLKKYFFEALIVSFLVGLITGGGSVGTSGGGLTAGTEVGALSEAMEESVEWGEHVLSGDYHADELLEEMPQSLMQFFTENRLVTGILLGTMIVSLIISLAIGIFLAPVIEVSKTRYYMESRILDRGAGVGKLLWGFNRNYLNVVWTMFLRGLIIFLGSLCCGLPGIYAAFCFYMVPYILAENPDMRAGDALRLSNEMMKGNKFGTFILRLSFIGWSILAAFAGAFTCGLGAYLVIPYIEATMAELYAELREPFAGGLNGFGYPDHGPYGPEPDPDPQVVEPVEQEPVWSDPSPSGQNGHVRGYYLNGVFYPYTEEELRAMNDDK